VAISIARCNVLICYLESDFVKIGISVVKSFK